MDGSLPTMFLMPMLRRKRINKPISENEANIRALYLGKNSKYLSRPPIFQIQARDFSEPTEGSRRSRNSLCSSVRRKRPSIRHEFSRIDPDNFGSCTVKLMLKNRHNSSALRVKNSAGWYALCVMVFAFLSSVRLSDALSNVLSSTPAKRIRHLRKERYQTAKTSSPLDTNDTTVTLSPTLSPVSLDLFTSEKLLETSFVGGEVGYGVMFDLSTVDKRLLITGLDCVLQDTASENDFNFEVYTREGSFEGYEQTSDGWTSLNITIEGSSVTPVLAASGSQLVQIMLDEPVLPNAHSTQAWYVTLPHKSIIYTKAPPDKQTGSVFRSSSDLKITVGRGIEYSFGKIQENIGFNGVIRYSLATLSPTISPTKKPEKAFLATKQNILVVGIDDSSPIRNRRRLQAKIFEDGAVTEYFNYVVEQFLSKHLNQTYFEISEVTVVKSYITSAADRIDAIGGITLDEGDKQQLLRNGNIVEHNLIPKETPILNVETLIKAYYFPPPAAPDFPTLVQSIFSKDGAQFVEDLKGTYIYGEVFTSALWASSTIEQYDSKLDAESEATADVSDSQVIKNTKIPMIASIATVSAVAALAIIIIIIRLRRRERKQEMEYSSRSLARGDNIPEALVERRDLSSKQMPSNITDNKAKKRSKSMDGSSKAEVVGAGSSDISTINRMLNVQQMGRDDITDISTLFGSDGTSHAIRSAQEYKTEEEFGYRYQMGDKDLKQLNYPWPGPGSTFLEESQETKDNLVRENVRVQTKEEIMRSTSGDFVRSDSRRQNGASKAFRARSEKTLPHKNETRKQNAQTRETLKSGEPFLKVRIEEDTNSNTYTDMNTIKVTNEHQRFADIEETMPLAGLPENALDDYSYDQKKVLHDTITNTGWLRDTSSARNRVEEDCHNSDDTRSSNLLEVENNILSTCEDPEADGSFDSKSYGLPIRERGAIHLNKRIEDLNTLLPYATLVDAEDNSYASEDNSSESSHSNVTLVSATPDDFPQEQVLSAALKGDDSAGKNGSALSESTSSETSSLPSRYKEMWAKVSDPDALNLLKVRLSDRSLELEGIIEEHEESDMFKNREEARTFNSDDSSLSSSSEWSANRIEREETGLENGKTVQFHPQIVTNVMYRPITEPEDVERLYYQGHKRLKRRVKKP